MNVPMFDPASLYVRHKTVLDASARRVLESGTFILGDEVRAFEGEFADYLGCQHASGVANGTDAIELALRACGIGAGDIVVTVAHTAVATVAAIERLGAQAMLVDVELDTMTIDLQQLEAVVTQFEPAAIVVVHLYGHPVDMSAVCAIAESRDVVVVEDCAQAHGAAWLGHRIGTFGHAAAFSFYPTKNLGAFGDGGAVVTSSPDVAQRVAALRQYGWQERYISAEPGINSRLDELQAAFLRCLLPHLDEVNAHRQLLARHYRDGLAGLDVRIPQEPSGGSHVYHQFAIRTPHREALAGLLRDEGIASAVLYPVPVHLQPAYRDRIRIAHPLPHAERICREVLCLPIGPHVTPGDVERVVEAVRAWSVLSA